MAYSLDGHRLLFPTDEFKDCEYHAADGVMTICSMAFATSRRFVTLIIPRSVQMIDDFVFGPEGGKVSYRTTSVNSGLAPGSLPTVT